MKSTSIIVGAVSSVVLIGAGIALHYLTPPVFEERFRTGIDSVRAMQQLGAEWSVETARVRADPTANFDGLAAFVPRMQELKDDLSRSLAGIPDLPAGLTSDSRAYLAAMESLRERVERFKTGYAVIRNSERYFPLASADLILRAEQAGNTRLARDVAAITVEMDAYLASPSEEAQESLRARLQELIEAGYEGSEDVASSIGNFKGHALALLDKRSRTQELFRRITSNSLSERTRPLLDILEAELGERRRAAAIQKQALAGIGTGVVLIWVFVGISRRSQAARGSSAAEVVAAGEPASDSDSITESPLESDRSRSAEDTQGKEDTVVVEALRSMGAAAGSMGPEDRPGSEFLLADRDPRFGVGAERDQDQDLMRTMLTTGTIVGLMGQTIGAHTRRMSEDLSVLSRAADAARTDSHEADADEAESAQRWRRLRADTRRLGFFAHRMVGLGRHLAPKDRESIDVNECLDEVLSWMSVGTSCVVERYFTTVPDVWVSRTEVRLLLAMCIDHVQRSFQDMTHHEAKLEIWTAADGESITVRFIHNGQWLPPEQRQNQFIPFYGLQEQPAALELPAARHLAWKYGGVVSLESLPDERSVLNIKLSVRTDEAVKGR